MSIAVCDEINQIKLNEEQEVEEEIYYVPPPASWLLDEQQTNTIQNQNNRMSTFKQNNTSLCSMMDHTTINDVYDDVSYASGSYHNTLECGDTNEESNNKGLEDDDKHNDFNDNDHEQNEDSKSHQIINNENLFLHSEQPLPPISQTTKDLFLTILHKSIYYSRLFYTFQIKKKSRYTDLGSGIGGFPIHLVDELLNEDIDCDLPPFSSLPWIDRQLVQEWRSIDIVSDNTSDSSSHDFEEECDINNEYKLAQRIIPRPIEQKSFSNASNCTKCYKPFYSNSGRIIVTRHHCRLCCQSFCRDDSCYTHTLPHLGYDVSIPQRVCRDCKDLLEDRDLVERIVWKLCRVRDYLNDDLTPYFEIGVDTLEDILYRLAQYTIQLTRQLPCLLLGPQGTIAVETVEILRRHGLHAFYGILLRQEFLQAADLLCKVAGINEDVWPLKSVHELSAAIFYALAENRYKRGIDPEFENQQHTGCKSVPNSTLSAILFYAPLALHFIYVPNIIDMQLLAAQQNWVVLYANLEHVKEDYPANALYVHSYEKIAVFAIRGTTTVQDVVTDIRAMPVPFPEEDNDHDEVMISNGLALQGMVRAAYNLYKENKAVIVRLVEEGYKIRFIGHSLGGGVSTLLGILFKADLQSIVPSGSIDSWLHVYAYGCPACINESLSKNTSSFITSIILHDDIVPRLTPTSIRKLMKHLLYIRETWVKEHFQNDVRDIKTRCFNVWSPRWRGSFVLLKDKKYKKKEKSSNVLPTIPWEEENLEEKEQSADKNDVPITKHENNTMYYHDGEFFLDALDYFIENGDDELCQEPTDDTASTQDESVSPSTNQDFLPSLPSNISNEDNQQSSSMADAFSDITNNETLSEKDDHPTEFMEDESSILLLEETPLPNMYIPGKVMHIYTHNGGYKANFVSPTFAELRQVSLATNMLTDHITQSYYDALLEVKSIRQSTSALPKWASFSSSSTCACCASNFTWASTCKSTAQEARDKHNCYGCGALVCHPCSTNRIPMQKYGIMVPVRVCDKCYYNCDFNFKEDDEDNNEIEEEEDHHEKVQKEHNNDGSGDWRRKNHNLVNDLVQRISCHAVCTNGSTTSPSSSISMTS